MTETPPTIKPLPDGDEYVLQPIDEPPSDREKLLLMQLEELRRSYEISARSFLDELAAIRALKGKRFVLVPRAKPEGDAA
ncbi:hypothetical protein [uncultured Nitratireductor sp.]|uniref:hypothetical protein n=1 Tax=uncultured Nitratireductor sp. TaxID=520953 RepID=UPI0025D71329|nr:hypothetical protein [uncultured Nitratireductor sp.]